LAAVFGEKREIKMSDEALAADINTMDAVRRHERK